MKKKYVEPSIVFQKAIFLETFLQSLSSDEIGTGTGDVPVDADSKRREDDEEFEMEEQDVWIEGLW